MIHPLHTLVVENTTILAWPTRKHGYQRFHFDRADAKRLGYRRGRHVFGHVAEHRVVRDGRVMPELVTVLLVGDKRILLPPL